MSARSRCRECGKPITLKKDGTLRAHNGNEYDGIWGILCDGAGRKPWNVNGTVASPRQQGRGAL